MSRHIALTLATATLVVGALAIAPAAAQEEVQPRVVPEQASPAPPPAPMRAEGVAIPRSPAASPASNSAVAASSGAQPRGWVDPESTTNRVVPRFPTAAAAADPDAGIAEAGVGQSRARGGGGGQAVSRGASRGGGGGQAVSRGASRGGASGGSAVSSGQAVPRGQAGGPSRGGGQPSGGSAVSRPRGDQPVTGYAVPRRGGGYGHVPAPYYYGRSPWYYSPYGFGWSLGYFYNPYWWGGYYPPNAGYGYGYYEDTGAVRLKVRPRDAQVFVDGYYVGIVDEFDGRFQRLRLDEGPQRIEIRAEGYETLVFEVRILRGRTLNLPGALKPLGLP